MHFLEYVGMIIKFKITNAPVEYCNRLFKSDFSKTHHANMLHFVKKKVVYKPRNGYMNWISSYITETSFIGGGNRTSEEKPQGV